MSKLAILGGEPVRTKPFEYKPYFDDAEKNAVLEVLDRRLLSGFYKDYRTGGPELQRFERAFADYHGMKYGVGVNSGTAALHAALVAVGVGPGDEVIVTSYTFTASASSILMCNAVPVFCDIDKNTFNMNPGNLGSLVTPKTKAILAVHLLGNPCDMDAIMQVADKYELKVVEDVAQSPGAMYNGKLVGTFGHASAFSFVETKNIVTGEGGMVLTNDYKLNEISRLIRSHGEVLVPQGRSYESTIVGWNYRMTEIEAAIGFTQLPKLDFLNDWRIKNGKVLNRIIELRGLKGLEISGEDSKSVLHAFALRFDEDEFGISRDLFLKALNAEGIEADKGYPHPLYMNPLFLNKGIPYKKGLNPKTEELCFSEAIWIRKVMWPNTEQDMEDIVNGFTKVVENLDELKNKKF